MSICDHLSEIINCLQLIFIFFFGGLLALVDSPLLLGIKLVHDTQESVTKYLALLTRMSGKGIAEVFAGAALWSSLTAESSTTGYLGAGASILTLLIGFGTLAKGLHASYKLEIVRRIFKSNAVQIEDEIGASQFLDLVRRATNSVDFDESDLTLIVRALAANGSAQVITKTEMEGWLNASTFILL